MIGGGRVSSMTTAEAPAEVRLQLMFLDQAYDRKSWHGPNLRGSIRGLDAARAGWRPHPDRHSIAEQVLHAAYWKYAARRRLLGDRRGSFPLAGSNWFPVADDLTEADWRGHVAMLESEHRTLRAAVAGFPLERLDESAAGGTTSHRALILGVAAHDLYHAGQIRLLKRLSVESTGAP
jgi:hypothetical protein